MALTKDDLQAIRSIVREGTDELAGLVNIGFQGNQNFMTVEFRKVNNRLASVERRLDVLDIFKLSDFHDLVKMLAEKNVLTTAEASRLHVHLERPAA